MKGSGHLDERYLSRYADGEVSGARRRRAEAHLQACAACRDALEAIRVIGREVAAQGRVRLPEGARGAFWAAVRGRIAAGPGPAPPSLLGRIREWARDWLIVEPRRALGSAAAAVLILAMGWAAWRASAPAPSGRGDGNGPVVEALEAGPRAQVMLFAPSGSRMKIIWIFEQEGT